MEHSILALRIKLAAVLRDYGLMKKENCPGTEIIKAIADDYKQAIALLEQAQNRVK